MIFPFSSFCIKLGLMGDCCSRVNYKHVSNQAIWIINQISDFVIGLNCVIVVVKPLPRDRLFSFI